MPSARAANVPLGSCLCSQPRRTTHSSQQVFDSGARLELASIASTEVKPYDLKVGDPLIPSVTATRDGRSLRLDYQLLDSAGLSYKQEAHGQPPSFSIYKGDELIASGSFSYG